ncbi:MAG: SoxR reducing system RseC family protein [Candidatus Delongbacteria bacterium]|nr:SoxR reducing system RseC family protein [Candidatus Delongbacteria bacterium]
MIETGIVVKSLPGGRAEVKLDGESCGQCSQKGCCSLHHSDLTLIALNPSGARIGDQVQVVMSESFRVFLAFLFFIVPVIFLMTGYGIGILAHQQYGWSWSPYLFCLMAFGGSFGLVFGISRKFRDRLPVIRAVMTSPSINPADTQPSDCPGEDALN